MSIINNSTEDNPSTIHPDGSGETSTGLEGWTKEDKAALLAALKEHGSRKVERIHFSIKTKSVNEITTAIEYYRNRAVAAKSSILPKCIKRVRRTQRKPRIPLTQWVKFLTDSLTFSDLHTDTPFALLLISRFEGVPPSLLTDQIDFKKIYHQLGDVMEGKYVTDNRLVYEVLRTCLMETITLSRSFIKPSTFKFLLSSIKLEEEKSLIGLHPSDDNEMDCVQHLCSLKSYNPLNIPEVYLAACSQVTVEEE